jgi:hypothetical protein
MNILVRNPNESDRIRIGFGSDLHTSSIISKIKDSTPKVVDINPYEIEMANCWLYLTTILFNHNNSQHLLQYFTIKF